VNTIEKKLKAFRELLEIMDELRIKCPWDKAQTNESLRNLTIEECYELADAVLNKDAEEIKKELGDILLHIVFYAKIGSDNNEFDIADVITALNEKLVYRHPHVFGDINVSHPEEVKKNMIEGAYLKRMAEPEDIAYAILFLASDEANFVTGQVLLVDGGFSLKRT